MSAIYLKCIKYHSLLTSWECSRLDVNTFFHFGCWRIKWCWLEQKQKALPDFLPAYPFFLTAYPFFLPAILNLILFLCDREMFALPNKKGFEAVALFLFTRLDEARCQEEFRYGACVCVYIMCMHMYMCTVQKKVDLSNICNCSYEFEPI